MKKVLFLDLFFMYFFCVSVTYAEDLFPVRGTFENISEYTAKVNKAIPSYVGLDGKTVTPPKPSDFPGRNGFAGYGRATEDYVKGAKQVALARDKLYEAQNPKPAKLFVGGRGGATTPTPEYARWLERKEFQDELARRFGFLNAGDRIRDANEKKAKDEADARAAEEARILAEEAAAAAGGAGGGAGGANPNAAPAAPPEFDTTEINAAICDIFDLMEGGLGALLSVAAGVGALFAMAFGAYKAGYGLIVVAAAGFVVRSFVAIFFGTFECGP